MLDQKRLKRSIARLRLVLYAGLLLLAGFFVWRYEVVRLPVDGVSPLSVYAPGDRLIVDMHPGSLNSGDAVLYRVEGVLLIGRIAAPSDSERAALSTEHEALLQAGALWIVKDDADAPGADSRSLGPIGAADVAGRIATAVSW